MILPILEESSIMYTNFAFLRTKRRRSASTCAPHEKPLSGVNAEAEMIASSKFVSAKYCAPEVSQKEIRKNETFELTCEITNESKTDGEEIVQLYFRDEVCKKLTPAHTLLDFRRATVPAGETKKVAFKVAAESLGYMNDELKNTVDAGEFTLFVSGDGKNFKTTKIVVTD